MNDVAAPPRFAGDQVRVKVDCAGICRTDLYVADGRLPVREPLILGHEFSGTVLEGDNDSRYNPGDRVTAIPLLACGSCSACREGRTCIQRQFLGVDRDGAFADEIVIASPYLRRIPEGMDARKAAYAEPVAAALAVLNAPLPAGGSGAVLGTSRIAELTARILRAEGFHDVRKLTVDEAAGHSNSLDFAVETEATEAVLQVMLDILRPGGIAVLKSRPAERVPIDLALAVKKGISLFAVDYGSFDRAIDLIASDALQLSDFLGDSYRLEDYADAFAAAVGGSAVKIFFRIGD